MRDHADMARQLAAKGDVDGDLNQFVNLGMVSNTMEMEVGPKPNSSL
jgi:hypothetical protein